MSSKSHSDSEGAQRQQITATCARLGVRADDLWPRYFALGGAAGPVEVEAYLEGVLPLPVMEQDLLAHAVNERLDEMTRGARVPYSFGTLDDEAGRSGPALTALVRLLDGMLAAPPERIVDAVTAAGEALGVVIEVLLVDYEQEMLRPVVRRGTLQAFPVDTTLAGQAFRSLRVLSASAGEPEIWVPLLDGVERLGVLRVGLPPSRDANDPTLREQLRWVALLAGHLITATSAYGDKLDVVRRTEPRTLAAELAWEVLPPMTAGSELITVTGMVHPTYRVGGDSFDYAISETTAQLAIFDANGHNLAAGLTVATALAAYRNARRAGAGLHQQAVAIDEAVAERSSTGEDFATAVLAELDLSSGRLSYVVAGHPSPLLLREGRVVKRLERGRRVLLGLAEPDFDVAEEILQADDTLVMYTDGIPEARDEHGQFFGEDRLIDLLQRQALSNEPPPETARRLSQAIMRHQAGRLQDDATVVLARWTPHRAPLRIG